MLETNPTSIGWPTLVTSGQVGHLIIILGGHSKAIQGTDSWNNCHLMLFNTPVTSFPFVVHVGQPLITSGLVLTLLSDVQLFHYLYSIVIFISPNIDETSLELIISVCG